MKDLIKNRSFLLDISIIFLGTLIASLGINLFLSHAQLLSGGATGIALIIEYISGFPSGISLFFLNIPLFVLSYKKLDRYFTLYSAIGMLSLSVSLMITKPLSSLININDILLYCLYGGALCGLGYGLIFLRNGSVGGSDIIAMIIRKKNSNFNIGTIGFGINILIVILGAIIFGMPRALYTLISMCIQSIVLDKVIKGFSTKKLMLILTDEEDKIIDFIMSDLHLSVTSLKSTGEFTHENRKMLYCVVTSRQMIALKNEILKKDPKAFFNILDIAEVKGGGFKNI
ncbi:MULTISPECIES: YitT family protein [Clostridium]|uniref:YitT family protein n=1 Tax=Clostridium cadaveris TaxID=1529 RepID=A0A1I2NPE6_9CLOT|nr:YitT family protein [Clostridium cadaveris]MDU4951811.1 YitT family protein [Clostridium sp.]MDM8312041.1 YitT family protein [Clostridium cadaveris]MDY4950253.1 YitT family protein [Clostridium cadaveris]NME64822.1 YitT family protein [Clostridium cadaveris]NWK12200.1 YitT family protein [Clostridium cadaveris]